MPGGIDCNHSIHVAVQEHLGVLVDQVWPVAMTGYEVEISCLQEIVLDSAQHRGGIALADFWDDDADGEAAARAQRPCEEIRPIVQLSRRRQNSFLCFLWNRVCARRTI